MWLVDYLTAGVGGWTYPLAFLLVALTPRCSWGFCSPAKRRYCSAAFGGVLAGRGAVNLWGIGALAALGSIVGDSAGYWLGRWLGIRFAERWGKRVGVTRERVAHAKKFFSAHGRKTVFLGRFASVFRSVIPLRCRRDRHALRTILRLQYACRTGVGDHLRWPRFLGGGGMACGSALGGSRRVICPADVRRVYRDRVLEKSFV